MRKLIRIVETMQPSGTLYHGTSAAAAVRLLEEPEDAMHSNASPKFAKWFGQSRVVDQEGRPLVVYHGGKKGIKVFGDNYRETIEWASRTGFKLSDVARQVYENPIHFFTDDPDIADGYADQHDNPETYQVYLRIERPLDLRPGIQGRDAVSQAVSALLQFGFEFQQQLTDREANLSISHVIRGYHGILKNRSALMGHDGIIMPDTCVRDLSSHTAYVVFSSNQIKTVTNLRFSRSDDIHR